MNKIRKHQPRRRDLREAFQKVSILSHYPTASSEEFVAVADDKAYTAPIMTGKDYSEFVRSSRNIIHADSEDETKNEYCSSCSCVIQNIMESCDGLTRPFINMSFGLFGARMNGNSFPTNPRSKARRKDAN
ncbi:hypothetical protein TNCV_487141 [Trichonephila clavipes]|nr:hypothetical protein TNCV_487141 [Trichonephila clavipes]